MGRATTYNTPKTDLARLLLPHGATLVHIHSPRPVRMRLTQRGERRREIAGPPYLLNLARELLAVTRVGPSLTIGHGSARQEFAMPSATARATAVATRDFHPSKRSRS